MRIIKRKHSKSFGLFVQEQRRRAGMTQVEYSGVLGVSPSYLGQMEQGLVPAPEKLGQMNLKDPQAWYEAAEHEPPAGPEEVSDVARQYEPGPFPVSPVPLRGFILDFGETRLAPKPARWGDTPMVRYDVTTDTLHPDFRRNDSLLLAPADTAEPGDIVIVRVRRAEKLVQYRGHDGPTLLIGPPNAPSSTPPTKLPEATIVGVLIRQVRRWKDLPDE